MILSSRGWGEGQERIGHVLRLLPQVDKDGRLAKVLVEVKDPLSLQPEHAGQQRLLANSFIQGKIQGLMIEDVVRVPRAYVRNGHQVWIMNDEDRLTKSDIEVVYRARDHFYVRKGVKAGDRIINSSLTMPVANMQLRTAKPKPSTQPAATQQGKIEVNQ